MKYPISKTVQCTSICFTIKITLQIKLLLFKSYLPPTVWVINFMKQWPAVIIYNCIILKTVTFFPPRANGISHKVERNVLNVSFQVNQYRSVIADLRNEISRLRTKLDEGRIKSSSGPHNNDTPVNQIRDQIVGTFREQMKLR